jgi:transcriptional regulator with GAF, ATPase, and Fis domain/predicted negative regulator of RcsB-dependent stress response
MEASARQVDWARLEEVGDLHFHASAYSSALDYYRQLLDDQILVQLPLDRALNVLRKATDTNILLGDYHQVQHLINEAQDLIRTSADAGAGPEMTVQKAVFQVRQAVVHRERGQLQDSLQVSKSAFSVLALTDEHADVARLQAGMGIVHYRLGRMEKAEEFYNDSLATFRRIGNDLGVANLLNNLALLHKNRCHWDQAQSLMDKALSLAEQIGASHLLPRFYLNQGIILTKIERLGEARPYLEKGLRLAQSLGDVQHQARLSLAMGRLEIQSGRLARAEELVLAAKTLSEEYQYLREATICDEYLGDILLSRGQVEKAHFNYQLGLDKARRIAVGNDLEGELLRRIGEAHLAGGDLEDAVAVSQAAIAVCEQCGELYELGFCHSVLGRAYAAQNDMQQVDHHFREAIATFAEQRLNHLWCQTIIRYAEIRRDTADEGLLLLLRRYLMDAQESGANQVSDHMLCQVLDQLAHVQVHLRQFDDALLTVFEFERHATGLEDEKLSLQVVRLRDMIESGLLTGVGSAESHLQAISGLPGLFARTDTSVPRNLETILDAGLERVEADHGFIAMLDDQVPGAGLRITARRGLTDNLAQQLTRWFDAELASERRSGTTLFSRLAENDDLLEKVPALRSVAASCVFMPIALHGRQFGLLFLGKAEADRGKGGFDRASLDFLATYMGFLALFLFEKGRSSGGAAVSTPIECIESFENIITQNSRMLEVLGLAQKVAPSDLTVLLNGETGTGKGLLAYSIHALSKRADKEFLSINCAAIPDSLLESELFGHVKGAFTGADNDKKGLLVQAQGGTLFLDEIGKMPLAMQGKLLHFLDTKSVRPVGSNKEIKVDVRIVAASKTDLHARSRTGGFLEDLYYRLVDFPLTIPPLRERADDVELLTRHFSQRFCQELGTAPLALDRVFMDLLVQHSWPGNIRELEKTLKRAIVLAQGDGVLRPQHLPREFTQFHSAPDSAEGGRVVPLKETLAGIECREIERALQVSEGNKSAAARLLKVSYPNLLKKIKHYGIAS